MAQPCKKLKTSHEGESTPRSHPINKLSSNCLAKIISCLPWEDRFTAETVSREWLEASKIAWSSLKVLRTESPYFHRNVNKNSHNDTFARLLERRGPHLVKLYVGSNINICMMPLVRDSCQNLLHLSLDFMKHDESSFIDAFSQMKKLKSFSIRGYSDFPDDRGCLTETEVLKSIHPELEEIAIISDESNCILSEKFASTLIKFKVLTSLTLHSCMMDQCVLDIIGNMETLKKLDLTDCWTPPGSNLFEPSKLDNLEYLTVRGLVAEDDFLVSVVAKCQKLVYLNVSNLFTTVESFSKIGQLKMLKYLDISCNNGIHDGIIHKFKNLRVLRCHNCPEIGDASIVRIMKNSPRLKALIVTDTGITAATIQCAVQLTSARTNGVVLRLEASSNVKETFLQANNRTIASPFLQL